jgi:hypothetical protein
MSGKIAIVADRILPIPPLPDAALAAAGHDRRARLASGKDFADAILMARHRAGKPASLVGRSPPRRRNM